MDFRFSPTEEAFRSEIRGFLQAELPADWSRGSGSGNLGEGGDDSWQFLRAFQKKLSQKGWLTLGWPVEHGGQAAGVMQQVIYNEEMSYHRAPTQLGVGPDRVGPTIILYGTEEQKARFLPGIAKAETVWCQGFSEPAAGSDLAALETKATVDGDTFVVNGQKIWTSLAHKADWCILLVRTDQEAPKHKGISYLLVDMKLPGITVAPLVDITGGTPSTRSSSKTCACRATASSARSTAAGTSPPQRWTSSAPASTASSREFASTKSSLLTRGRRRSRTGTRRG